MSCNDLRDPTGSYFQRRVPPGQFRSCSKAVDSGRLQPPMGTVAARELFSQSVKVIVEPPLVVFPHGARALPLISVCGEPEIINQNDQRMRCSERGLAFD